MLLSPVSKHLVTAARKKTPLTGRNLKQNGALGGRSSPLTSCTERETGTERETHTQREAQQQQY